MPKPALWIPAFAGMTGEGAGMTIGAAGMTGGGVIQCDWDRGGRFADGEQGIDVLPFVRLPKSIGRIAALHQVEIAEFGGW